MLNDSVNNGRSKKKKGISETKVGDSMIKNPAEEVEHFKSHFCSVGTEFGSKLPRSNRCPLSYMGQNSVTSFYACPTSDIEVKLIIWRLKCSSSFPRSVKPIISKKYARLINVAV